MVKVPVIEINGNKAGEIELPYFFNERIREDLILRVFFCLQTSHKKPYGAYILAGKEVCASGKARHRRRKYKTLYGYGISRVPRKIISRRGDRFYWIGAFSPGTVGGRGAHPPIALKKFKKVNKKEKRKAMISALSATSSKEFIGNRYEKYKEEIKKAQFPLIINTIEGNSKEIAGAIVNLLEKNFGNFSKRLVTKEKKIRAGKGKARGRKYKKKVGVLLVISLEENKKKIKLGNFGIETVDVKNLGVNHLAPGGVPGRFTIYTLKAIEELKGRIKK